MKKMWLVWCLCCMAWPLQADVYKWLDADGKIQYGDAPPKGVNATRVSGGVMVVPAFTPPAATPSAPAAAPAPAEIESGPRSGGISARAASSAAASSGANRAEPENLRERLLEACRRSRGTNCESEVDAQLNGQGGTVFVPVPGWSRPPIRPTPKPQPEVGQSHPMKKIEKAGSQSSQR